jgi:hypothetical protein
MKFQVASAQSTVKSETIYLLAALDLSEIDFSLRLNQLFFFFFFFFYPCLFQSPGEFNTFNFASVHADILLPMNVFFTFSDLSEQMPGVPWSEVNRSLKYSKSRWHPRGQRNPPGPPASQNQRRRHPQS